MRRMGRTGAALVMAVLTAACAREAEPPAEVETPTLDVTTWTEQTELFMEYPPLVAGETALFAVHLTRLSDFTAMTAGRPSLALTPETGGVPVILEGQEPSRPGVFRIEAAAPVAGRYTWALLVDAPGLTDRHELGAITVYPDQATAFASAETVGDEDPTAVSYLKEPQWTNGFATAIVREVDLRRGLRAPATIEPLTGGEAVVSAPAAGRFTADALLSIGTTVRAGQEVGHIQPRLISDVADRANLVAAVAESEVAVDAAQAELARAQRLLEERAVPSRRVEDARRAVLVATVRLTAAQSRLAQRDEALLTGGGTAGGNAFVVRVPISGRIVEVYAALGATFEEGVPLFRIVRTDRVELQVHVPAADAPLDEAIEAIAIEIPGRPDPVVVDADHMHHAGVIDPRTRALPVQFDVANPGGRLLIGQSVTAVLYGAARQRLPAVPGDAVLMEAGRPYVFVQTGGETFSRRYIDVAGRDGDLVGVRSGVRPGERVVTHNAYDVQLASAAGGLPAEGHVH